MKKINYLKKSLVTNKSWLILILLLSSCTFFTAKTSQEERSNPTLATVGNQQLRKSDVAFLLKESLSEMDSGMIVERYIQSWIKNQLLVNEASKAVNFNTPEFTRKLQEYKEALMIHEFEKNYIQEHLIAEISEAEIVEYYEATKENFILKENIVRANFVKVDKKSTQRAIIERALRQNNTKELAELCMKFAATYFIDEQTWISWEELLAPTPLGDDPNAGQLLKNNPLVKTEDENYSYYFGILEYKLRGQIPPMEFVKDELVKILTNKRMVKLKEQLYQDIYTKAVEKNEFRIYE
jgi:hypothetical protein